jgi:hypothetical protein
MVRSAVQPAQLGPQTSVSMKGWANAADMSSAVAVFIRSRWSSKSARGA